MMGFGSSGIETTSSWSLWKTTREFIEKARRAAVVDGGLPRSANPGRDRQAQAEIQPSTTTPSTPKPRSAPLCQPQATPCSTQAISFFLAMENRERTENRGRERRREGEQRKKN
uniref:Uncharacterized protein n=1 Tax=Fagus sylvatica TaxID=28930 RepID=A0A2N9HC85_FAGSY